MMFILLPNGETAGECTYNGQRADFTIADDVLSFHPPGGSEVLDRHRILNATEGDTLTEYVCAAGCNDPVRMRQRLESYEATIETAVALLQAAQYAAKTEASPREFLQFLIWDRATGTEPHAVIFRLVRGLAENEARGMATEPVAKTFRTLALAELVEALAAIPSQH
jgi:hypothetical protein